MTTYEAITRSGTYAPGYDDLITLADSFLVKPEKLQAAWLTDCSLPGQAAAPGIFMVSTHRVIFVSDQTLSMYYADCIGIGDTPENMLLITSAGKKLGVHCSKQEAKEIRAALLDAIEAYPAQKQIIF